ncbi:MAG TPA: D-2-hydroxyacid dehydrogenase [Methylomirabilota bacterium]|nr:D-2-hydroxyacid dehydrogenase [Methylomirabilota bacterium]
MSPRTILLYNPWAREARAYADLVRLPRRSLVLHVASTPEEAEPVVAKAEILYGWDVPASVLARARSLRWVQCMGAGVERLLLPELPPGVRITRAAGIFGPWMVEYTLGWCLWVTQRMEEFRQAQRERRWKYRHPRRLRGATLCVIGLGDIGRTIARAARVFGMRVVGVSRSGQKAREAHRVYKTTALRKALAEADWVVLAVPLSPATRGLIGKAELAAMKPTAWLINIARGPIVDEDALVEALREKRIGGAVLDVFNAEPLPAEHPLWALDNAVITPHISGPSTPEEIAPIFNDNLRRYLAGRPLRHEVNRKRGY